MQDFKHYTESNRMAWNQTMPHHQKANGDKWDRAFQSPGHVVFSERERRLLESLPVSGKDIAHLCCNNGVELLSLKNMRAGRCTGFDISEAAIEEARDRSRKLNIKCEYVRTDIYDIQADLFDQYDIIYISIGCFGWMPDLNVFFQKAKQLLKKDGTVFIHEQHPFTSMLPNDFDASDDPLKIIYPYFKDEPYAENDGIDYIGRTNYQGATKYWFTWTLSDILTAILENQMTLIHFQEYKEDISTICQKAEARNLEVPLSYTLIAKAST